MDYNEEISQIASKYINNTSQNVFLTGRAGTGKTTFLKALVKSTHKKTIIAAPTGIAAINAGGVTLHSLFQLPFGIFLPTSQFLDSQQRSFEINTPNTIMKAVKLNKYKRRLISEMELLIIDEVSMLRADLLDAIDTILKRIKRSSLAFGGVQVLFIGDLLQLPPVVKDYEYTFLNNFYNNMWFFEAHAIKNNLPIYIELEKIYRQTDKEFIELLNRIRNNNIQNEDIEILNKYYIPENQIDKSLKYIHLTTHNYKADKINTDRLSKLTTKTYSYFATAQGTFSEYNYPIDEELKLKEGAQIMFIKNDYSGKNQYYNGKLGTVKKLGDDSITVTIQTETEKDDLDIVLELYTWENTKFELNKKSGEIEKNIVGTFTHYPIKLAWAITIHKSQGLTFENAIIDIEDAFARGQVYVALSRLTSINGLILSKRMVQPPQGADSSIIDFAKNKLDSKTLKAKYAEDAEDFILQFMIYAFNIESVYQEFNYHYYSYTNDEKKTIKKRYTEWAKAILDDVLEIKNTSDKFVNQLNRIKNSEQIDFDYLLDRISKAEQYYSPLLENITTKMLEHINLLKAIRGTKAYTNEVIDLEVVVFNKRKDIKKSKSMLSDFFNNKEFLNDNYKIEQSAEREEMTSEIKKKKTKKDNGPKQPKEKTHEISYKLYRDNKSISEIAEIRNLTKGTILGHMCKYIETGHLSATDFIEDDLCSQIAEIIYSNKDIGSTDILEMLKEKGIQAGYQDIKMVRAELRNSD